MSNLFLFSGAVTVWGFTWIIISEFQVNTNIDPVLSVAWRMILSSMIIFMILLWKNKKIKFSLQMHLFFLFLGTFLYSLNYVFFYSANVYLISAIPAVVFSLMSISNLIGERLYFKKNILPQTWFGAVIGIVGVVIIFYHDLSNFSLTVKTHLGLFFAFIATLSASMGNLIFEYQLRNYKIDLMESMSWSMLYGGLVAFLIALVRGSEITLPITNISYMFGLLYLSIFGTVIAFLFYLNLIKNVGPGRAGYISIAMPIFALCVSFIFEDLKPSINLLIGLPVTLLGLVLILKQKSPITPTNS